MIPLTLGIALNSRSSRACSCEFSSAHTSLPSESTTDLAILVAAMAKMLDMTGLSVFDACSVSRDSGTLNVNSILTEVPDLANSVILHKAGPSQQRAKPDFCAI